VKSNGSIYVAVVFVALGGYFSYQWWFNPARAVKLRLGEIALALSAPANEESLGRLERLSQLRRYLSDDVHVRVGSGPELASREQAMAALSGWTPPKGGIDVAFADSQIVLESETAAHAFVSVEMTTSDPQGQPSVESRDASINLAKRDGEWVMTSATAPEKAR
jgi:hypothetical protein